MLVSRAVTRMTRAQSPSRLRVQNCCGNAGWFGCPARGSCSCTDSLFRLPQRGRHRILRDPAHNGIDYPANSKRDVPAQNNCLKFQVDTTVSLLEPGKTVDAPDITTALTGRKFLRTRLAVVPNFLYLGGVDNGVPTALVDLVVAGLIFGIERSRGHDLLICQQHRVLVAQTCTAQQLGIDNGRLVNLFVVTVIPSHRQDVFERGIGDESCSHPIVDQAGGHRLRVVTDRRNQNVTRANSLNAVRHFVDPKEWMETVVHLRICRLDVCIPGVQGLFLQLSPLRGCRSNQKTQADEANQNPAGTPNMEIHSAQSLVKGSCRPGLKPTSRS